MCGRSPPRVLLLVGAFGTGIPIVIVGTAIVITAVGLVALGARREPGGVGQPSPASER